MWSVVLGLLRWCLKYWKNIASWLGVTALVYWGAVEAFDGISSLSDWGFNHWADVMSKAVEIMGTVQSQLAEFSASFSGWMEGFVNVLGIEFVIGLLIAFGSFFILLFEWTIVGMFLALLSFGIALLALKFKLKAAKSATNSE